MYRIPSSVQWSLFVFVCAFAGFFLLTTLTSKNADSFSLTILHFNDLHSRALPGSEDGGVCTTDTKCTGGIAQLLTAIEQERKKDSNTLVLTSGDVFSGSPFFTVLQEAFALRMLDALRPDAMSLGNHEFDLGDNVLASFIEGASFPVLTGNVVATEASPLFEYMQPYLITEVDGVRVGIIAATTKDTPNLSSPSSHLSFTDEVAHLQEVSNTLTNEGVDVIIALTHVGYEEDAYIAEQVPAIDVIVGGHSDTLLSNVDTGAKGPYPTLVTHEDGSTTAIVQTLPYGQALGKLSLIFDAQGNLEHAQGEPIAITSSFEANAELSEYLTALQTELSASLGQIITNLPVSLQGDPELCRNATCPVGNVLTDALREAHTQKDTIALINSGSIRGSLPEGPLTLEALMTVYPFPDKVAQTVVSGATLLSLLEESISRTGTDSGGFLQISGLQVYYNPNEENGKKICATVLSDTNVPLEENRIYTVITNAYLAQGGDGYDTFPQSTTTQDIYESLRMGLPQVLYTQSALDDRIISHCNS